MTRPTLLRAPRRLDSRWLRWGGMSSRVVGCAAGTTGQLRVASTARISASAARSSSARPAARPVPEHRVAGCSTGHARGVTGVVVHIAPRGVKFQGEGPAGGEADGQEVFGVRRFLGSRAVTRNDRRSLWIVAVRVLYDPRRPGGSMLRTGPPPVGCVQTTARPAATRRGVTLDGVRGGRRP